MNPQPPDPTIQGHPTVTAHNKLEQPIAITVCCECGELRTVLWLAHDRWYCSKCKTSGQTRPTTIPIA